MAKPGTPRRGRRADLEACDLQTFTADFLGGVLVLAWPRRIGPRPKPLRNAMAFNNHEFLPRRPVRGFLTSPVKHIGRDARIRRPGEALLPSFSCSGGLSKYIAEGISLKLDAAKLLRR